MIALQFYSMHNNFNISIPSIPNSIIKFKIQDVKLKGFIAKQMRFREDKSYLARKFINTFDNIKPPAPKTTAQTDDSSRLSTLAYKFSPAKQDNFRVIVDKDIKRVSLAYQEKKSLEKSKVSKSKKMLRGYSFARSGVADSLDDQVKKHCSDVKSQQSIIDNDYFNETEESIDQDEERRVNVNKKLRKQYNNPTAVFRNEDRWMYDRRILTNKSKLGPGEYIYPKEVQKIQRSRQLNPEKVTSIQRIKQIFKEDIGSNVSVMLGSDHAKRQQFQKQHHSSMFVASNQDRFGKLIYPIVQDAVETGPGPGSYEYNDTLQEQVKRIIIVEEQRKLLKQWFNE